MTGDLLELAASGCIYFQDEASQLIASTVTVREGEWFLDVCAAPGGKTTAIGGRYRADGAVTDSRVLFAGDKHARRVIQLQETCELQGVGHVNIAQYDAEKALPFADESFDVILVDAPCSGTGTIRHNPEIRYFLRPEDFDLLKQTQLAILKNVSKLLRPNGKLVYSTCSLESEENEDVCRAFLEASPSFRVVRPKVADRFLTENGYARTFPHRDDMDGFFAAEFIREN
jgi:16S rRNA (cytosine967-C5)-methyltransferase